MRMSVGLVLIVAEMMVVSTSIAQVPRTLSYQGVLTDTLGRPRPDGAYDFTFRLYEARSGGTAVWSETKTLSLSRGLFSTSLGDQVPIGLRFDVPYWLSVQIAAEPELSPRIPLTAGGYSFRSLNADTAQYARIAPQQAFTDSARIAGTVSDNAITGSKIADGSLQRVDVAANFVSPYADTAAFARVAPQSGVVDSARIAGTVADASITSPKLGSGVVTTAKLADNAVTGEKIADGSIQGFDVASNFVSPYADTATYARAAPQSGVADSARIAGTVPRGSITSATIADNAVGSAKIQDGAVATVDLADASITQAKIAPGVALPTTGSAGGDLTGTYPSPTVAAGVINTAKLADGSVLNAKLGTGAVTGAKISTGQVVKSINTLRDSVTLLAGNNVTITPGAHTLTIASSAGLALPYSGSSSSAAFSFDVTNTGTLGTAAAVKGTNGATGNYGLVGASVGGIFGYGNSSVAAVGATQFGNGYAVKATNYGTGRAGYFVIDNSGNSTDALAAETNGSGIAVGGYNAGSGASANFYNSAGNNASYTLYSTTRGTRGAATFNVINPANDWPAVVVDHWGDLGTGLNAWARGAHGTGVYARGAKWGVIGAAAGLSNSVALEGIASGISSIAVRGLADNYGMWGEGSNIGVYAHNASTPAGRDVYLATRGLAADMYGDLYVHGNVTKSGGSFKIDHPLDPANKYLYHSFVESPDMKNIYDGVVALDALGEATVTLPAWFEALNRDFRYQLTAIGAPAPNLYVARKISDNSFAIAGGSPGMEVSWQVTATRQDAWANAHRIPVEQDKTAVERGFYEHPELFGQAADKTIQRVLHPETGGMQIEHKKMQIDRERTQIEQEKLRDQNRSIGIDK